MSDQASSSASPAVKYEVARTQSESSDILEEQKWHQTGQNLAMSNINEKIIEQKEKELQQAIMRNYSQIKNAENELSNLQLQLKLTAGPKKSALLLLRKKIEAKNDKVLAAREKLVAAKKLYEAAEAELKVEECEKQELCQELNLLVHQSTQVQLDKLEQLTQKIEGLNSHITPKLSQTSSELPISSAHGLVQETEQSQNRAIVTTGPKEIVQQPQQQQQQLQVQQNQQQQVKVNSKVVSENVSKMKSKPGNLWKQRSGSSLHQSGLVQPQNVRQQTKNYGEFQGFD